jgi:hypothetical protein
MGLTLLTFLVGWAGLGGLKVSLLVLALALIKGQLIGDYFMGLGQVRGPWRWVIGLWLLIPGGLITLAFVMAAS